MAAQWLRVLHPAAGQMQQHIHVSETFHAVIFHLQENPNCQVMLSCSVNNKSNTSWDRGNFDSLCTHAPIAGVDLRPSESSGFRSMAASAIKLSKKPQCSSVESIQN